jgi:hypothetical protein
LQREAQAVVVPTAALDFDLVHGAECPVPRQFFIAGIRWPTERRAVRPLRRHRRAPIRRY